MEAKKKTPEQLRALENLYSEEKYPAPSSLEEYASTLGLTYKQVRGWFVEKRRREKRQRQRVVSSCAASGLKFSAKPSSWRGKYQTLVESRMITKGKKIPNCYQRILSADHILEKVFRKDGPPLGVKFDFLPSRAFSQYKGSSSQSSLSSCRESQRATKRRKVFEPAISSRPDRNNSCAQVKKHGMGKGLMTAWKATNPDAGKFPTGINFGYILTSSQKQSLQKKRPQRPNPVTGRPGNKLSKRKHTLKKRKVEAEKKENQKQLHRLKCGLALEGTICQEYIKKFAMLVDDEELELREMQAGANQATCCNHFATSGMHGCSLCKDLLAKFPPFSVKMKLPFCMQPWDSSPEIIKKLFKVFHFLYTHAVTVDICPFSIDEFAQALHEKDSLLLGKIHVALLKLLLADVEAEVSSGYLPQLSKSCKFLALIHSLENQEVALEIWKRSLNPLTWIEILRQVLLAAGFGPKQGVMQRETPSRETLLMEKYGLRLGTLKGDLFSILLEEGNNGIRISDLARMSQIVELNIVSTTEELEILICSTLSSDVTLFEKISSSAYRLRINPAAMEADESQSDSDSGSVEDVPTDFFLCGSAGDSDCDSQSLNPQKSKGQKTKSNSLTLSSEIDVSHPGEPWLLGLMEGEYSDLSIEEKLNALVALIDLLSDGSSIRVEGPSAIVEYVPGGHYHGSGAKIKRSSVNQHNWSRQMITSVGHSHTGKEGYTSFDRHPVDSSTSITKFHINKKSNSKEKTVDETNNGTDLHPMLSLFLGSDRRYNRYWIFLGPCNAFDPGHRRVYFESSEDGHWEVIDSKEGLCELLSVLDDRGKREAFLIKSLEKRKAFLCEAMSTEIACTLIREQTNSDLSELDMVRECSSSPVSDVDNSLYLTETSQSLSGSRVVEIGMKGKEKREKWSHIQAFDSWIWSFFYSDLNAVKYGKRSYMDSLARCESCHDLYWRDERHCKICHTTFELDFDLDERYAIHSATCTEKEETCATFPDHKVLCSQLQSLKAATHAIESVMPEDALVGAWTKSAHKLWVNRLRRTSSLTELSQVLTDFVGAINVDWLCQSDFQQAGSSLEAVEEIFTSFPSLPQTSSAIALWMVKLDTLLAPYIQRIHNEKKQLQIHGRGKRLFTKQ